MTKAAELINWASDYLKENKIEEHLQNSEWLLCHQLNKPHLHFRAYPETNISSRDKKKFIALVKLKANGMPLSYITEKHNFMGVEFKVNKNVLIPRPETEDLVSIVLKHLDSKKNLKVLELCTGSGVISCILALKIKNATITATDISKKALKVTKLNAEYTKTFKNIKFLHSDLFKKVTGKFDVIISNPPYCSSKEMEEIKKEITFEPKIALHAGEDGLDIIRKIISLAPLYLKKNGYLFMEIGIYHRKMIMSLASSKIWQNVKILKDFNGLDRYLVCKLKNG